jgi:RecQ-mediated genome instability protein 2
MHTGHAYFLYLDLIDFGCRPSPCSCFPGKYVMVMGVLQATSPEPVIRAVKMADLTKDAAIHRKMWKLEVEDLQQLST